MTVRKNKVTAMTYVELYHKAVDAFNPNKDGLIIGYPVEVLYNVSRLDDAQGWEQQVDVKDLRNRLSPDYLDKQCVGTVLGLI